MRKKILILLCLTILLVAISSHLIAQTSMGEGMVIPRIGNGAILHFYTGTLKNGDLKQTLPSDSLVIKQGENSFEIATAPSWFLPEIAKMDYEILQLRATTISRKWIEVIVNTKTSKKAWVERDSVNYLPWADFLLTVFAVELIHPSQNPIRLKPLDNAAIVLNPVDASLRPQAITGDWMLVSVIDEDTEKETSSGWIRWKKGNLFLIAWSLLS